MDGQSETYLHEGPVSISKIDVSRTGEDEALPPSLVSAKEELRESVKSDIDRMISLGRRQETAVLDDHEDVNLSEIVQQVESVCKTSEVEGMVLGVDSVSPLSLDALETRINFGIRSTQGEIGDLVSQIGSIDESLAKKNEELRNLHGGGFARKVLNFNGSRRLKKQIQSLENQKYELRRQMERLQEQVAQARMALEALEQVREKVVITTAEEVITNIIKRYKEFESSLLENKEIKVRLNERFVEAVLVPELSSFYGVPRDKVDEYVKLISELLKERATSDNDYPPEKKERIEEIDRKIEAIFAEPNYGPYFSKIHSELNLDTLARGDNGYNQIMGLLVRNDVYEVLQRLAEEIGQSHFSPKVKEAVIKIINDRLSDPWLDFFVLEEAALKRWGVVRDYPGISVLFDLGSFSRLERRLQEKTINSLLKTPVLTDKSIRLGYTLLLFNNAEAAPFVILNCWREPGPYRNYPFLSDKYLSFRESEIYKYITSLPEGEVEKLKQMNIPGLMDIIDTIRENPDNFNNWQADNPLTQLVERNLVKLCMHFMGDEEEGKKIFAIGVLKGIQGDLGKEFYDLMGNLLRDYRNPNLQEEILNMVLAREMDEDATIVLIKNYSNLVPDLQIKLKEIAPMLLRRFIGEEDQEVLRLFGDILGMDVEEIKQTIDFIVGVNSFLGFGIVTYYDNKKFNLYADLAREVGMLSFIQELSSFGYHFSIDHAHVLLEMIKNREVILSAIKDLRADFPDFKYDIIHRVGKNLSREIFIFDPYEVFLRQSLAKSFEGAFDKLYFLQKKNGTFSQNFSDGLIRILREDDSLIKKEAKENIDEFTYKSFHEALQRLISVVYTDSLKDSKDFYLNQSVLRFLARRPEKAELLFGFFEHSSLFMRNDMKDTLDFIFANEDLLLQDISDLKFLNMFVDLFGLDSKYFLFPYLEFLRGGEVTRDNREQFIEIYFKPFAQTYTRFSSDRMRRFKEVTESSFGRVIANLIFDEVERNKILFDYACFQERLEKRKIGLVERLLGEGLRERELRDVFRYLRWLPEYEVLPEEDTLDSLKEKYLASYERLRLGFSNVFPNSQRILDFYQYELENFTTKIDEVCKRLKIDSRTVTFQGIRVNLPKDFIRRFNKLRKEDADVKLFPELTVYFVDLLTMFSTSYTVEDLMLSQIGDTEDLTGRRRGRYTPERLLQEMNKNIEASLLTWSTAISYQREKPSSSLFIIANERTAPADLAAEYLDREFALEFGISQSVDYDKFFEWFKRNEQLVDGLFERYVQGENIKVLRKEIPLEVLQWLGVDRCRIIPIYRLKVPSSLNASIDEPPGIDTVLNFLKFVSIIGGRVLFMDESTRSAPRSIECLYNVLQRRQENLGGIEIRLFGKIKNAIGQNGTELREVAPKKHRIEIGFIDPWYSEIKPVTDDSSGFVPEVRGEGVVEIVYPSFVAVSPYGLGTIQDLWKIFIASEVVDRFRKLINKNSLI